MNKKIWMVGLLLLGHIVDARYLSIKNDSQFVDEINSFDYAVACFIKNPHPGKDFDKQLKKDVNLLQDMVKATSETAPYKKLLKKEVGFLVIDVDRESVRPLVQKYKIKPDEMPQFLLFKQGKAITTISGELAKLVGFVSKSDLLDFIDDYLGKNLDTIVEKKAEEAAQDREMQLARYEAYASYGPAYRPYNAYGAPYFYAGHTSFYPVGYYGRGYYGYGMIIP